MMKVREILEKAQQKGAIVLNTNDTEEISGGLVTYLLFTTGTQPNNRSLLKLDEPERPISNKELRQFLHHHRANILAIFQKLFKWIQRKGQKWNRKFVLLQSIQV